MSKYIDTDKLKKAISKTEPSTFDELIELIDDMTEETEMIEKREFIKRMIIQSMIAIRDIVKELGRDPVTIGDGLKIYMSEETKKWCFEATGELRFFGWPIVTDESIDYQTFEIHFKRDEK